MNYLICLPNFPPLTPPNAMALGTFEKTVSQGSNAALIVRFTADLCSPLQSFINTINILFLDLF